MIAKSLFAAAAAATTMTIALPAGEAQAKTNIDINLGLGFGGGYYGGGYYGGYYGGGYYGHPGYISCRKGRNIVAWQGFRHVRAVDCSLPGYKYTAWKFGRKYLVRVNAHGYITHVSRI